MAPNNLWSRTGRRTATIVAIALVVIALGAAVSPPAGADDATPQIARSRVGGEGKTLTDGGATHVQPAWSPDGSTIVYAANPDGYYHLFAMKASGQDQTQLTSGSWNDVQPTWSPDGSRIAFTSNRGGNYNILTMAADGSDVRRVTVSTSADMQPTWSPGGGRIGFASNRGGNWNIFTVAVDATALSQVTFTWAADVQPSWSPDGTALAFASNRAGSLDIYTANPRGGPLRRMTYSIASDTTPAWSQDGASLAFSSNRTGYFKVYLLPSSGGTAQQVTDGPTLDGQPSWKPTGTALTFSQLQAPPPADIYWGIYSAPRDGMSSDEVTQQLESAVGRQFSGERIYQNLSTAQVPTPDMERLASIGGYIYLNINSFFVSGDHSVCARWADVAAGRYDGRWTALAQAIEAFGYTIHFGYHHEMTNNTGHHPVCGTPTDYVRAYNHLHDLFTRLGVTNVRWVWAPTASAFNTGVAWRYMPAKYDILAVDGYSRTYKWRSPAEIFSAAHRFAVAHGKSMMIGEVGCDEYPRMPMRKARWLQAAANMFHSWTDLRAIMWTNTGAKSYSFWLDSSPQSLTMFRMAGVRFK